MGMTNMEYKLLMVRVEAEPGSGVGRREPALQEFCQVTWSLSEDVNGS